LVEVTIKALQDLHGNNPHTDNIVTLSLRGSTQTLSRFSAFAIVSNTFSFMHESQERYKNINLPNRVCSHDKQRSGVAPCVLSTGHRSTGHTHVHTHTHTHIYTDRHTHIHTKIHTDMPFQPSWQPVRVRHSDQETCTSHQDTSKIRKIKRIQQTVSRYRTSMARVERNTFRQ